MLCPLDCLIDRREPQAPQSDSKRPRDLPSNRCDGVCCSNHHFLPLIESLSFEPCFLRSVLLKSSAHTLLCVLQWLCIGLRTRQPFQVKRNLASLSLHHARCISSDSTACCCELQRVWWTHSELSAEMATIKLRTRRHRFGFCVLVVVPSSCFSDLVARDRQLLKPCVLSRCC